MYGKNFGFPKMYFFPNSSPLCTQTVACCGFDIYFFLLLLRFSFFIKTNNTQLSSEQIHNKMNRGVGTVKFQVKQLKKIPDEFANLLNFLHFQPLISGEAVASPASPVPTPLHGLSLN